MTKKQINENAVEKFNDIMKDTKTDYFLVVCGEDDNILSTECNTQSLVEMFGSITEIDMVKEIIKSSLIALENCAKNYSK